MASRNYVLDSLSMMQPPQKIKKPKQVSTQMATTQNKSDIIEGPIDSRIVALTGTTSGYVTQSMDSTEMPMLTTQPLTCDNTDVSSVLSVRYTSFF